MFFIEHCLKQTISPLCQHEPYKHLQLFLLGNAAETCVLTLFVTNKKFLCKELTEKFYNDFFRIWVKYKYKRQIKRYFRRMVMTKGFFTFLVYVYLIFRLNKIIKMIAIYDLKNYTWGYLEKKIMMYPNEKMVKLFDCPSLSDFNDLHLFLTGSNLMIPIPNHCIVPCFKLFSLKDYDNTEPVLFEAASIYKNKNDGFHENMEKIPAGNFMFAMARALVENFCHTKSQFLVPIHSNALVPLYNNYKNNTVSSINDIFPAFPKIMDFALANVLKNCLATSILELPVVCFCKTKCFKYVQDDALVAVICASCGYCLNLGKERLLFPQMFSLSSMFYFRDKQEKGFLYSMHSDVVYCSLCGSKRLYKEKIYDIKTFVLNSVKIKSVVWKCVIGSNIAYTIFNEDLKFDVILPCSCRSCFSVVKVANINYKSLLKIVAHSSDFQCQECLFNFKETCIDIGEKYCEGCVIAAKSKCYK